MSLCHHHIKATNMGKLLVKEQYTLVSDKAPVQLVGFSAHYNKETSELHIGGQASVLNQCYDKLVVLSITTDNWATRHEAIGNYESHDRKRAVFAFSATLPIDAETPVVHVSAFVSFTADGKTSFDNNKEANFNYTFPLHERVANWHETPLAVVHTSTVSVHSPATTFAVVFGTVSAANWSPDKKVLVRYTHDNWASSEEVVCNYCCSADGRDNFVFEYAAVSPRTVGVSTAYCVRYQTCGTEFWDGNKGYNFTFATPVAAC